MSKVDPPNLESKTESSPKSSPPLSMSPDTSASDSLNSNGFNRGFWLTLFILLISIGSLEYFFSQWSIQQVNQYIDSSSSSKEKISNSEVQKIKIDRQWVSEVFQKSEHHYQGLHQKLQQQIKDEMARIRVESEQYISVWTDWYFSVTGEYTRLAQLATGNLEEYMAQKIYEYLLLPLNLDQRLIKLEKQIQIQFTQENQKILTQLNQDLQVIIDQTKQKGEVEENDIHWMKENQKHVRVMGELTTLSTPAIVSKLMTVTLGKVAVKTGVKALTGAGVKGSMKAGSKIGAQSGAKLGTKVGGKISKYVFVRLSSKGAVKMAAQLWVKLLTKFGIKTGSKAGSALAAGGSATVACAWLGVGAAACGVGAAILTWVTVDKIIIEIDEYLNRDEFETQLRTDLKATWTDLESEMLTELSNSFNQVDHLLFKKQGKSRDPNQIAPVRLIDQIDRSATEQDKSKISKEAVIDHKD